MKKIIGSKTLKTGIGAATAMVLAEMIGLKYALSAGIITILSIQNTRRESLQIAFRRMVATCIALFIGSCMFKIGGFNAVSFGIYVLLFIPIAVKVKVTEGIVPASVLVTHLLGEKEVSMSLLGNELMLMVVGAGVALIVNLYMPSLEGSLLEEKRKVEELMYQIIIKMEQALIDEKQKLEIKEEMQLLEGSIKSAMEKANQYRNNSFIGKKSLYEKYFEMRLLQYQVMNYMEKHFEHFYMVAEPMHRVAVLTHNVALSVHGKVKVEALLDEVEDLRQYFKESSLPASRDEFENRAMLYQFLTDIEQFLNIKKRFKNQMTEKEQKEYDGYYIL